MRSVQTCSARRILKPISARKRTIFTIRFYRGLIKIFACEGVIIGGGAFVLSSVLTAVICAAVSRSIFLKAGMTYLAIAELNPLAIPLLFVIIGVFTAVGCIAPVIRLARLTPKKCTSVI